MSHSKHLEATARNIQIGNSKLLFACVSNLKIQRTTNLGQSSENWHDISWHYNSPLLGICQQNLTSTCLVSGVPVSFSMRSPIWADAATVSWEHKLEICQPGNLLMHRLYRSIRRLPPASASTTVLALYPWPQHSIFLAQKWFATQKWPVIVGVWKHSIWKVDISLVLLHDSSICIVHLSAGHIHTRSSACQC